MKGWFLILIAAVALNSSLRAEVYLSETFNYADGPIVGADGSPWTTHNGTSGEARIVLGELFVTETLGEDFNAPLANGPFESEDGGALYAAFTVRLTDLPTPGGSYFAHFMQGSATLRGRLFAFREGADDGMFRLGIANAVGSSADTAAFPDQFALDQTLLVVLRWDLAGGVATLWVNPASDADASVSSPDAGDPRTIAAFGFRQASSIGEMFIDNLTVASSFDEAIEGAFGLPTVSIVASGRGEAYETGPSPARLAISRSGVVVEPLNVLVELTFDSVTSATADDLSTVDLELTIPAGASSLTLELQPVDDDLPEGIERFSVSIAESGNYHASPDSVVISIIDNDDPAILLDDPFEYANGPTVGASGSPWQNHSGGEGEANLLDGFLELTSSGGESEDINAQLLGAPYPQDEPATLYAGFDVIVDALPSAGGTYFAHFIGGTSSQRGRLFVFREGAAAGMYRLAVANAAGDSAEAVVYPQDLEPGVEYRVVISYVVDQAATELQLGARDGNGGWSFDGTSISATDETDARDIMGFAFRQNSGLGRLRADNLRVGTTFETGAGPWRAVGNCEPSGLEIARLGDGMIRISFTGGSEAVSLLESQDMEAWTEIQSWPAPDVVSPDGCGVDYVFNFELTDGTRFYRLGAPSPL